MRQSVFKKPAEPVRIGRFEIVKRLGSGAMGLVYEVIDPRTGGHVALKTIRSGNPRALALFKREFRSLARVTHPNLVSLYELGREDGTFFFTMELIRGVTLLRYLWGSDSPPELSDQLPPSPILDVARLRRVLSQLVASVATLHELGKLHRDIKPTNVMVTAEGRVVLMDFGFVSDQLNTMLESTQGSLIVGTPAFMPPEQSRAERLTAAADWYSVGATLYLALTGQPPYSGLAMAEVLMLKESQPPAHPRLRARGIPADLGDLCVELLAPEPEKRPDEASLLRRTAAAPWVRGGKHPPAPVSGSRRRQSSMIGLTIPLTRLGALYAKAPSEMRLARVVAPSGQGKSRLVAHFLEVVRSAADGPKPLILRTRCNPGDAVPAQALDDLVDGLARHLRLLERSELEALLPPDAAAVVSVFPVLSQVPALADRRSPAPSRDAGFAALRHLLSGLARLRPIVLWIDDLQWSDAEGVRRLIDLLAPPDPPPLMMILSYRSEDTAAIPELARLVDELGGEEIAIGPLAAEEAVSLAESLLDDASSVDLAVHIAAEAQHSPLWIHELALMVAQGIPEPTLADLVGRHIGELPRAAVELTSLAAIAQRPLPLDLAAAAGIDERALYTGLRRATAAHLLRLSITDTGERIAPFDERVRTAILSHLDGPSLRERHRRLAAALEQRGTNLPELLIHHLRGAGELDRAQRYALLHAEQREVRGDHYGAATLFRLAHELGHEDARGAALLRRLAGSLAAAGLEVDAARVLQRAHADIDRPEETTELRLIAARLLLTNGVVEPGREALAKSLAELGMTPLDAQTSGLSALLRRGQLRLRGTRFRERSADQVPRRELLQVDAAWTASVGFQATDPILATEAQTRHFSLALRVGEPVRVGRAFTLEALRLACDASDLERASDLQHQASELAERCDAPRVRALVAITAAAIAFQRGLPGEATVAVDAAFEHLKAVPRCGWERTLARDLRLGIASYLGDLAYCEEHLEGWIREADEQRSLSADARLRSHRRSFELLAGRPPQDPPAAGAPPRPLDLVEWPRLSSETEAALAAGNGEPAWRRIDAAIGRTKLHSLVSALAVELRARAALIAGGHRLADAERDRNLLRRHPLPVGLAFAEAIHAALAAATGDPWRDRLGQAAALFTQAGLELRAALCRWRLADDGPQRLELEAQLAQRGVANIARSAALLLPWPAEVNVPSC